MFNIMFTAVVVIIVFFIVDPIEPFAAWIIRTVGIVYGFFSSTLIIFVPKAFALVFIDKLKADKNKTQVPSADSLGTASTPSAPSASAAS